MVTNWKIPKRNSSKTEQFQNGILAQKNEKEKNKRKGTDEDEEQDTENEEKEEESEQEKTYDEIYQKNR